MAGFVIITRDTEGEPVEGVVVAVFTATGQWVGSDVSSAEGRALLAGEGELFVRASKPGYMFVNTRVIPEEGVEYILSGTNPNAVPPDDPRTCRVSGVIVDPLGGPLRVTWPLSIAMDPHYAVCDGQIITSKTTVRILPDGFVTMNLRRGRQYLLGPLPIRGADTEGDELNYARLVIPESPLADLADLITPYVTDLSISTSPITLNGSDQLFVPLTLTLSDGRIALMPEQYLSVTAPSAIVAYISAEALVVYRAGAGGGEIVISTRQTFGTEESPFDREVTPRELVRIQVLP
jgi:hypothetical protein